MDLFGSGIPKSVPVSEEEVQVDAPPTELFQDDDVQDVENSAGSEEIPEVEVEYEGNTEDLGGRENSEIGDAEGAETFKPDVWSIQETMDALGSERLDTLLTMFNNMARKIAERSLERAPRRDLNEEDIRKAGLSEQIIKCMHHYAPSLPVDNPTTGLAICCATLVLMNMTSPLLTPEEIAQRK